MTDGISSSGGGSNTSQMNTTMTTTMAYAEVNNMPLGDAAAAVACGGGGVGAHESRLEPLMAYTLTTLRLKQEKWTKMMNTHEFRLIVLDWLHNTQRRTLLMTLSPGGLLVPRNSLSDLYYNYAIQQHHQQQQQQSHQSANHTATTAVAGVGAGAGAGAGGCGTNESQQAPAAGVAAVVTATSAAISAVTATATLAAATALLIPLPPPSSSFSTLDGVPRGKCVYFVRRQVGSTSHTNTNTNANANTSSEATANIANTHTTTMTTTTTVIEPLTAANFHAQILYGDLPVHSKIETLAILFDEIYQPLLVNPLNRKLWPEIVAKDLEACMKEVRHMLTEIKGKTNNRTILSLLLAPPIIDEVAAQVNQGNLQPALEPKFRSVLEEMFINWSTQIHEILHERSECVAAGVGENCAPTPNAAGTATTATTATIVTASRTTTVTLPAHEINFWLHRKQNLQNIYEQLRSSSHQKLAHILESSGSAYFMPFVGIFKRLVCAWHEAQDVTLWLQPLLRQTSAFNALNFSAAGDLVPPLVHVLHLIWCNARYYRSTARMTTLLQCTCNLLVHRASEDLELAQLFRNDADDGLNRIDRTLEVLESFKVKLIEYKEKYGAEHTQLPALPHPPVDVASALPPVGATADNALQLWRFCADEVFGLSLEPFQRQLAEMRQIFEAAVSFQTLEKLEISGVRGKYLTEHLRQLHTEFKLIFEQWTHLNLDWTQQPTAPSHNWRRFKRQQAIFFRRMRTLEEKLATLLVQAYEDCVDWEHLTKLTVMFGSILQRSGASSSSSLPVELSMAVLPHILATYDMELRQLEANVHMALADADSATLATEWHFPPLAGATLWLAQHRQRCEALAGPELNVMLCHLLALSTANAGSNRASADNGDGGNDDNDAGTGQETAAMAAAAVGYGVTYEALNSRRDVLIAQLRRMQSRMWQTWQRTIDARIAHGLREPVLQRCNATATATATTPMPTVAVAGAVAAASQTLEMNFPIALNELLKEAKYLLAQRCANIGTNTDTPPPSSTVQPLQCDTATQHSNDAAANAIDDVAVDVTAGTGTANNEHEREDEDETGVEPVEVEATDGDMVACNDVAILPQTLLALYAQRDELWQRKIKLIKITEFYNDIRAGALGDAVWQLIHHEIDAIDERVNAACDTVTWQCYDADLIEAIYVAAHALHTRLLCTQANLNAIYASMRRWSRQPLHQRSPYGRNLLDVRHQRERVRVRREQCAVTCGLLNRLLIVNFCLFFNYDAAQFEIYSRDLSVSEFLHEFPDEQQRKYGNYLASVDEVIRSEVRQSMKISLAYLYNEMTATTTTTTPTPTMSTSITTTAAAAAATTAPTTSKTLNACSVHAPMPPVVNLLTTPSMLATATATTTLTHPAIASWHGVRSFAQQQQQQHQQHHQHQQQSPIPTQMLQSTLRQPAMPLASITSPIPISTSSSSPTSSSAPPPPSSSSAAAAPLPLPAPLFEVQLELATAAATDVDDVRAADADAGAGACVNVSPRDASTVIDGTGAGAGSTAVRFVPAFDVNAANNFQQIVEQLLVDINQTDNCIPTLLIPHLQSTATATDAPKPTAPTALSSVGGGGGGGGVVEQRPHTAREAMPATRMAQFESVMKLTRHNVQSCEGTMARHEVPAHIITTSTPPPPSPSPPPPTAATATPSSATLMSSSAATGAAVTEMAAVLRLNASIRRALHETMQSALAYASEFNAYAELWQRPLPHDATPTPTHATAATATTAATTAIAVTEAFVRAHHDAAAAAAANANDIDDAGSKGYAIMEAYKKEIDSYNELHETIDQIESRHCINGWLALDIKPLKYALLNLTCKWANSYKAALLRYVEQTLQEFNEFVARGMKRCQLQVAPHDLAMLLRLLSIVAEMRVRASTADTVFKSLKDIMALLKTYSVDYSGALLKRIEQLPLQWKQLQDVAAAKMGALQSTRRLQQQRVAAAIQIYNCLTNVYAHKFATLKFFAVPCRFVYTLCDRVSVHLDRFAAQHRLLQRYAQLLEINAPDGSAVQLCLAEAKRVKQLWDFVRVIESCIVDWRATPWHTIDTDDMENECKKFTRDLRTLDNSNTRIRDWAPYVYIVGVLKELVASLRAITELQNAAITERHWLELMQATKLTTNHKVDYLISLKVYERTTLAQLLALQLHQHEEEIRNTVDRAIKEATVTKMLDEIKAIWSRMEFDVEAHAQRPQLQLLKVSEELIETLDDNQVQLQNIATSKHIDYLLDHLTHWQRVLSAVDQLVGAWFDVQRKWLYLEGIFIGTADIRAQLPADAQMFEAIDAEFTQLLGELASRRVVVRVVIECEHVFDQLTQLQQRLAVCEKALNDYLEKKRLAFPRFYFISAADLLDILSNGSAPRAVDRHLIKLFDSILRLRYARQSARLALGMHAKENDEYVDFTAPLQCTGRVELWLGAVIAHMRRTLCELFCRALHAYADKARDQWLNDWPAQVALCCSQIVWTADVNRAFGYMEEGYENAMKELHKRQTAQLNALINLLLGELSAGDRQKIMTICTIDVHNRDVVGKIIHAKVDNQLAFQWQSQLRHRWLEETAAAAATSVEATLDSHDRTLGDCYANICDAEFRYAYEYLGNTTRLVITPLTDRCYITLTQSLHLVMGGAPAGPAGTGKTETTKDLGRALGMMVYVFNCSEQMDYKSCGNIYKGLAQTGAWGCFDEFNRISVEVLSVVAVQVKCIQEAIRLRKKEFVFMGEMISLLPSVGIFITMNPGYAGRTELPENLKTLFRPCAMIVPDFALICEIMLMAEGFQEARLLARKFITLYTLCKELLSKQDHYDWGLRAIKSVLVVAGTLKRDDHSRPEDQVLMRALRDFNIPKIVTEDMSIFMGLIGDLFPALDVPRKRVFEFEKTIRRAVNELKLQPEESFLMKVVQLQELLDVRHSVFIVGNAGTGKTRIWQALRETYRMQHLRPVCDVLNPKALSNDELFGIVNATTREWKDGLFSTIMREQANMLAGNPKWIVLDGDIDPMWIESLNTLMDDNKILTLASNERISLQKDMRLLFEVGHLRAATPATVSRAGILYINPQDLGWSPFVSSWLETRLDIVERGILTALFEKYFPNLMLRQRDFRRTTPITDMAMIQMTCRLLECLLAAAGSGISTALSTETQLSSSSGRQSNTITNTIAPDTLEPALELIFVYATMWAFGSALHLDHIIDWRREFHKWWTAEFKDIKLPLQGCIFDYNLNMRTLKFQRWSEMAAHTRANCDFGDADVPLQNVLVPTAETVRLSYFLKLFIDRNLACVLVGNSGCGKSAILRELFHKYANVQEMQEIPSQATAAATATTKSSISVRAERKSSAVRTVAPLHTTVHAMHFNFYTTSEVFQKMLDSSLERKSGRNYAPSGPNRRLIYFVNDLNMPEVDAYGTVQPHTIMRQFMDYRQWYDRQRLQLKDIRRCQFVACMNPTAGSFTIDPRLLRHFCVFSVPTPNDESLQAIYGTILNAHLEYPMHAFNKEIKSIAATLVQVGIGLHRRVESAFLPTAVKFHYIFNLRDLTAIYQGVLNCTGASATTANAITTMSTGVVCTKPAELIRLYVHEAHRVYHDRLVDTYDIKSFKASVRDIFKKDFEDFDEEFVFAEPLIYSHFAHSLVDQKYASLKSWDSLYQLLMEAQGNYNDVMGYMNLVMFEDAMVHICRINRILESPRGNALLIGVGGSGKQTLARLVAFISSLNVFQLQIKSGTFSLLDMKDQLGGLLLKVGLKSVASVFLMSDAQIPDESALMLINDLLASGEIPELYSDDQMETIINGIRNEVKQSCTLDTKENCWRFFVEKIRRLLKVVLCFSPVGQTLRVRARKFPAIISRTAIDWFHEWPKSALESVSKQFLSEISYILPSTLIPAIGSFMAYVHGTVNQISRIYLQNEKRHNYTTPKTFLEYIFLYRKLLQLRHGAYTHRIQRLDSGMSKLAECARQVDTLKDQLAVQEVQLTAKNAAADKLIVIVSAESEKVKREKHSASEEEQRVRIIEEDVSIKTKLCEEDLRKAEPALVAAQAALNTLNKNNLTELKSFGSPPKAVVNVCAAVMVLLATNGRIPRDRSWKAAKLMMVRVDQFLNDLLNYDKNNIHPNIIELLQEYLKDPEFNPDKVVQKSVAAAGLCAWVINVHRYHQVFLIVGPKQQALHDSQAELTAARERLRFLKCKIDELEAKLAAIQAEFENAVAEKQKCQREADKTAFTIDLAHRLIHGLANENVRWRESVQSLHEKIGTLPGDILLISSFLSYVGCFTRRYREELQHKMWLPTFVSLEPCVPHTVGVDPLTLFSDDAQIAAWNNEGLPMDRMSTENATILEHATRWPLMIDPQLQGIKWIKNRYGEQLVVLRLGQRGFLDQLERAMSRGDTMLIEQIEEVIDTVLEPLLSRALIKKGRYIRIGDKEMDFNPQFRLLLHTKLANPHYKPEIQAQTTLINFTVTPDGLEEQLLAEVVKMERPDLEQLKTEVTTQQNKFKISLKALEDELLARLACAGENVLDDHALVINLEATKRTVDDIETKVQEARVTATQIDDTRNIYRAAAKRAAILYFVLTDLGRINPIYRFSLKSFLQVFKQAILMAAPSSHYEQRVENLVNSITLRTYVYTLHGLFETDKLTFAAHMVLRVMSATDAISKEEIEFLLRFPHDPNCLSPLDFVSRSAWGGIKSLALMEHFYGIDKDMENYPKRWYKFLSFDCPEREQFPGEWKQRTPLQKLCIIRALRPDRMTHGIRLFIELMMGPEYANVKMPTFTSVFEKTNATTPIFFVLSPGVDPIREVEQLGQRMGFNSDAGNLTNISLGQGQELAAEQAITNALASGRQWVILQNIHLVVDWLPTLDKIIEQIDIETGSQSESQDGVEANQFRLFISAEPAPDPQYHVIPQGILESSLKIVNEPPAGMAANLHKAWDNFSQETLETCTQEAEFKSILFALCYFHAVTGERRKFGPQGWNRIYPFNIGDLSISANVLHNYLEGSSNRIPWVDLRYLFGEIMYGGHITDDWDRRLCSTYLEEYMRQELIDGDFELCPGFPAPPNLDYDGYHRYINEVLPAESPLLYGLHTNAEIGFLTNTSDQLLRTIFELQPRESELSTHCGAPREELVRIMIDDFMDKLRDEFNLQALLNRVERKTPFVVVALQECERMNALIREIKRSLRELMLGLKGELTITLEMEQLDHAIFYDHLPESWDRLAYPSILGLQGWFADLLHRIKELSGWLNDFKLPATIWLGALFNPQSFLTAIMQESARKHDLPLDRMCLSCDVTKKDKDDVTLPPMEGAFVHALYLDGASWDCQLNSIVPLHPKEMLCSMPVIYIKSIVQEKQELIRIYECPLYKTRSRGSTYVWTFNLKTRERAAKWILAGVALLLQP